MFTSLQKVLSWNSTKKEIILSFVIFYIHNSKCLQVTHLWGHIISKEECILLLHLLFVVSISRYKHRLSAIYSTATALFGSKNSSLILGHVCNRMRGVFWEIITVLLPREILRRRVSLFSAPRQWRVGLIMTHSKMVWMISESDVRANVRCHGDA